MFRRHYTIVAPKNIRPNSDYHVSVSLHDSREPCDIQIGIEGGANYRNVRDLTLTPFTSRLIQFETGDMIAGRYKIIAAGLRGILFKNETDINFNAKNVSILIQTDKAIYKPGDMVRFRVLVLDSNMKPSPLRGTVNIHINVSNFKNLMGYPYTNCEWRYFFCRMEVKIVSSNGQT